ncbi:MAG: hypothetical protein KDC54_04985 [Lewinella sp.]|nr:hypothetical protein [Lewinella sp.]
MHALTNRLTLISMSLVFALCWLGGHSLSAQRGQELQLSLGASLGYASVTYGERETAGSVAGLFAELSYGQAIGRLQVTNPLMSTFSDESNLEGGYGVHGSLGYNVFLTEQFHLPLMAVGGVTVLNYNNGFNGSTSGSEFTDASPQVGLLIAPYYQISPMVSIQGAFRYLKGFVASDESKAINLLDLSLGLRLTF